MTILDLSLTRHPVGPTARSWRLLSASLGALAAGFALGILVRACAFWSSVRVERVVVAWLPAVFARLPAVDPVYTAAALHTVSSVRILGLAVGGPPGGWLHQHFPRLLLDPAFADHGLVRFAVQPGSPILGRLLAAGIAHASVLAIGLMLVQAGQRRRSAALTCGGIGLQLAVALGILGARPSLGELEAAGLSFAAGALAPWLAENELTLTSVLSGATQAPVVAVLVALALTVSYLPGTIAVVLRGPARGTAFLSAALIMAGSVGYTSARPVGGVQVARPADSPLASSNPHPAAIQTAPASASLGGRPLASEPAPSTAPAGPAPLIGDRWFTDAAADGPSRVEVSGSPGAFQLLVNGQPEEIRGMGLNTRYAALLSPEARAAQLDRDFASLSQLGVNTVVGWDPREFDAVLLDTAARHGIGVVLPFDLDPSADYTDPTVRASLTNQVLAWVERYQSYPALRMWGVGNEVLHKIVHPAWVGPQDPARDANARAFASWLVQTADAIHALDPNHPVTYRSAEDAFVPWVRDALQQQAGGPRPWFVFGTNCYQSHLSDIVDNWSDQGTGGPLWVSEFAPGGLAVPDRPDGFRTMWGYIVRHPGWVLGGAVYAWTRNGPEAVDQTFGLTDDGAPVDGASLDTLAELFHRPPPSSQ